MTVPFLHCVYDVHDEANRENDIYGGFISAVPTYQVWPVTRHVEAMCGFIEGEFPKQHAVALEVVLYCKILINFNST